MLERCQGKGPGLSFLLASSWSSQSYEVLGTAVKA